MAHSCGNVALQCDKNCSKAFTRINAISRFSILVAALVMNRHLIEQLALNQLIGYWYWCM